MQVVVFFLFLFFFFGMHGFPSFHFGLSGPQPLPIEHPPGALQAFCHRLPQGRGAPGRLKRGGVQAMEALAVGFFPVFFLGRWVQGRG